MNYERASQGILEADAVKYAEGIREMNALANSLQREGKLPVEFSEPVIETPTAVVTPALQDRQLRDALRPFVQEYKDAKVHTPELVDHTWQNMWGEIGRAVDFKYQVPSCDRAREELAQLRKENKAVLLLPDDIFTPEGLVRFGRAFPLMRSWTTDPEHAAKISYGSNIGGCIDIEMSLDAPYRTSKGYKQKELVDKIAADKRAGQRLPTYFVGSEFSQLLTGHYFDENTWSRLPESFSEGSMLVAHFRSDGSADVNAYWHPELRSPDLGGRSEGVKRA
ncbi:MAG: hypothetical protein Q8P92_04765 [Candidatus Daviesbacteria bacterium]|nr:hypothetical protein [Candidatus Daviesbacteria bacterium]